MASKLEKVLNEAERLNTEGSEAYKDGKFSTAVNFYTKAGKLNRFEPKYFSNNSAALFETGNYLESLKFICSAWEAVLDKEAPSGQSASHLNDYSLLIRLATRYAKAKVNAVQEGKLSMHRSAIHDPKCPPQVVEMQKKMADAIESFATDVDRSKSTDAKVKELDAVWSQLKTLQLRCSEHNEEKCDQERKAAIKRFRDLKIFKSAIDPALEYFKFGHDDVQSLMHGLNNALHDEYCLDTKAKRMRRVRKGYSFLFGGSGDARHVFATIIHVADFFKEKNSDQLVKGMTAHFTLVDVHPAALARVVIIFALLQQIGQIRDSSHSHSTIELLATAFYIHTAVIMPEVCRQIVQDTATRLVDELPTGTHPLQKIFHVDQTSLQDLLRVLKYWTKPLPKTVPAFFRRLNSSLGNCKRSFSMHGPEARKRNQTNPEPDGALMDTLVEQLAGKRPMGDWGPDPNAVTENSPEARILVNPYQDSYGEADIWDHTRVLLPPKVLLSKFLALEKVVCTYKKVLPQTVWRPVVKEVEDSWKVNPTLFDNDTTENSHFGGGVGYPAVSGTPYDHLFSFGPFNKLFERSLLRKKSLITGDITAFDIMGRFFELASEALFLLRNALKIEVVVGDVMMGVARLVHGDLGERPKTFPDKWMRVFLSNVPDYTNGALNTSVHLSPYMEKDGVAIANCLLNTGLYTTVNHQVSSYALLPSAYFSRFLGTDVLLQEDNAFSDIVIQAKQLPIANENLATKPELHFWLARLLLCTLCNGKPAQPPLRVDLPNNIHAFFHALMHLHRVGFPAHWLGEFVQAMLDDKLVTDAVAYTAGLPVPLSAMFEKKTSGPRKVSLACWNAEIRTILALVGPALPFALILPDDFPVYTDVTTFRVNKVVFQNHVTNPYLRQLSSPFARTAVLLFYKDEKKVTRDTVVTKINSIIEGDSQMKDAELQMIFAPESIDLNTREVTWKMTKQWYRKMKADGWKMTVFRTELSSNVTAPTNAIHWEHIRP
ncbi:hypothetical protein CPB83DRAFT_853145 [Crepidotus variabilis]|uniref:DUF4470 domain-containing protein n=1 Tax=Crepidotus variabilis TaxID=179855 RepID=A0A9P6EGD1_9AGAR|nr:hypothetical protein CPB83DRAFT_853145 [Crepidotus variabilis]